MTEEQFAAHVARNRALRGLREPVSDPKPVPALLASPRTFGAGMVEFTVPGAPVAWARARTNDGRYFNTPRMVNAQNTIRSVATLAGCIPIVGAVRLEVTCYLPIPRSWPKDKRQKAAAGLIRPTTKPDLDNLLKQVGDALQGTADKPGVGFADDRQVVETEGAKWYSSEPRTVVRIIPLDA